jgi:hypothetical protein
LARLCVDQKLEVAIHLSGACAAKAFGNRLDPPDHIAKAARDLCRLGCHIKGACRAHRIDRLRASAKYDQYHKDTQATHLSVLFTVFGLLSSARHALVVGQPENSRTSDFSTPQIALFRPSWNKNWK